MTDAIQILSRFGVVYLLACLGLMGAAFFAAIGWSAGSAIMGCEKDEPK